MFYWANFICRPTDFLFFYCVYVFVLHLYYLCYEYVMNKRCSNLCAPSLTLANLIALEMSIVHIIKRYTNVLLWPPCVIGQAIIFSSCGFFLLSFFFFFFFRGLISAVEDWMSTILPHMV